MTPRGAVSEGQIVLAAEVGVDSPAFGHLEPMVEATVSELERAGIGEKAKAAVADAGYWHHDQMDTRRIWHPGPDSADAKKRKGARPGWQGGR